MRVAVYLPLVLPLLLVPFTRAIADRLPPRAAAWLLTVAAVVLGACSAVVTGLVVAAGAVQLPPVVRLGHWSVRAVRHALDPGAALLAVPAAVVLAAVAVAMGRVVVRHVRTLARSRSELGGLVRDCELVVLPDRLPVAYALPGRTGHVVVSTGMLSALDASERRVLLAHERAHLCGRHHLITTATRVAAMANPLLRPLHRAAAYTVERWADEYAAREVGDRRLAARAIAKAALAGKDAPVAAVATPLLGATTGPVPRRIVALLHPPSPGLAHPRTLVGLAALVALAVSAAATLEATTDLHALLEIAQSAAGH